ncbi:hypothetical protein [Streptomyces sp. NPDC037389]|uniref:hypothetical protein n=1 Tax=Streptomyces sp. NPDC037389 TaxID=3155369 RepID=UPI0033DD2F0C
MTASATRGAGSAKGLEPIFESLAASWAAAGRAVPGRLDPQWEDLAQTDGWPRMTPVDISDAEGRSVLPLQNTSSTPSSSASGSPAITGTWTKGATVLCPRPAGQAIAGVEARQLFQ